MEKLVLSLMIILLVPISNIQPASSLLYSQQENLSVNQSNENKIANITLPFIENKGQISDKVKFYANTFAGTVFVTEDNITYSMIKTGLDEKKNTFVIVEKFLGKLLQPTGIEKNSIYANYFVGQKEKWLSNIATYDSISLGEIWQLIDVELKINGNNVEKIFKVKPKATVQDIKIAFEGITSLSVDEEGLLLIGTEFDTVSMTKPIAFQDVNGVRKDVTISYLVDGNTYGFTVDDYDPRYTLIIDPLLNSTYVGGTGEDEGRQIVLDNDGNVFVIGRTFSSNYPTTSGAYDETYNGHLYYYDDTDISISKFSSDLSTLLASTFVGGSNLEEVTDIAIDISDNVYITGNTNSADFPTTLGSYDTTYKDGTTVFVSKLSNDLSTLSASTFIGSGNANSIVLDSSENVFITGAAGETFPTTPDAYAPTFNYDTDNSGDAFVSKLSNDLTTLLASTFIGGGAYDVGRNIALDSSGNVFITGVTESKNFPTTLGAFDRVYNIGGSDRDGFVSKLSSDLTTLLASTFIGESNLEEYENLALDNSDNVFITGLTLSKKFPTKMGAFDRSYNGGDGDAFISKLSNNLTTLLASTFVGGKKTDIGSGIAIDDSGNVFITGSTISENFPTTSGTFDTTHNAPGNWDAFVSKFSNDLTTIIASTFVGGGEFDIGIDIALDSSNNAFIIGRTNSQNFPVISGSYDETYNGDDVNYVDIFAAKLRLDMTGLGADGTTGTFSISENGTANLNKAVKIGPYTFEKGTHDLKLKIDGSYIFNNHKASMDKNSLAGTLIIDESTENEVQIPLVVKKITIAKNSKTIGFDATLSGVSGSVNGLLEFKYKIDLETQQDQTALEGQNGLKVKSGKGIFNIQNTASGRIDFS